MGARLVTLQIRGTTVLWNRNQRRCRRLAGTWTARVHCLAAVLGVLCSSALLGVAGAQTPPTSPPSDASSPLIVGRVVVVPYAPSSMYYVTGLAILTIFHCTAFPPKRFSDGRFSATGGFPCLYGP